MATDLTAKEVMEACWQILQDEGEPHKFYPEPKLIPWINEGVEQIRQRRPDCIIQEDGITPITFTRVTSSSDIISIDRRWFTAIVEWVVMRCFLTDAEDEGDQKQAALHSQYFENYVMR